MAFWRCKISESEDGIKLIDSRINSYRIMKTRGIKSLEMQNDVNLVSKLLCDSNWSKNDFLKLYYYKGKDGEYDELYKLIRCFVSVTNDINQIKRLLKSSIQHSEVISKDYDFIISNEINDYDKIKKNEMLLDNENEK